MIFIIYILNVYYIYEQNIYTISNISTGETDAKVL